MTKRKRWCFLSRKFMKALDLAKPLISSFSHFKPRWECLSSFHTGHSSRFESALVISAESSSAELPSHAMPLHQLRVRYAWPLVQAQCFPTRSASCLFLASSIFKHKINGEHFTFEAFAAIYIVYALIVFTSARLRLKLITNRNTACSSCDCYGCDKDPCQHFNFSFNY